MMNFRPLRRVFGSVLIASLVVTGLSVFDTFSGNAVHAQEVQKKGRVTGLPLPRFVSLKSNAINMRVGPGRKYAISWVYKKRGLPVEIIQEFDRWRRIRAADGTEGWVLHSLLTGRRTAIVAPWDSSEQTGKEAPLIDGKSGPVNEATVAAKLQAGLVVSVRSCEKEWCAIEAGETSAWLPQDILWGVYPGENVDG